MRKAVFTDFPEAVVLPSVISVGTVEYSKPYFSFVVDLAGGDGIKVSNPSEEMAKKARKRLTRAVNKWWKEGR